MLTIFGESAEKAATKVVGASMAWAMENPQGRVEFAEIEGKSIDSLAANLEKIETNMATLGLQQLADNNAQVDVTATEAILKNISETAPIRVLAGKLQDAIETAHMFFAQFFGLAETAGGSVKLNAVWNEGGSAEREFLKMVFEDLPVDERLKLAGYEDEEERTRLIELKRAETEVILDDSGDTSNDNDEDEAAARNQLA